MAFTMVAHTERNYGERGAEEGGEALGHCVEHRLSSTHMSLRSGHPPTGTLAMPWGTGPAGPEGPAPIQYPWLGNWGGRSV